MRDANRRNRARAACRDERVTRSEYAVIALVLLVLIIAAVLSSRPAEVEIRTQKVMVSSGDTLWDLAERHPVPGLSTQQTVRLLSKLNGLQDSRISAGVSIEVPAAAAEQSMGDLAMR